MPGQKRKLMTTAELAAFLGHSPHTVNRWRSLGCPARKHGRTYLYDRTAVAKWLRARNYDGKPGPKKREKAVVTGEDGQPLDPDVRFRLARAEKVELDVAKLKGEMVDRADVEEALVRLARVFRTSLLGLPARLAPVIASMDSVPKVEKRIRRELEGVLREFSRGVDGI
jgi:phage terminase Nu1 subunit (DNA packaging protein)